MIRLPGGGRTYSVAAQQTIVVAGAGPGDPIGAAFDEENGTEEVTE